MNIFDNIISNASQDVVDFPDADPGLTITHDYNDVYDPGDPPDYDDYPPGPYTVAEDPLFVDSAGGDYHLPEGSPQKQHAWSARLVVRAPPMDGNAGSSASRVKAPSRSRGNQVFAEVSAGERSFTRHRPSEALDRGRKRVFDLWRR